MNHNHNSKTRTAEQLRLDEANRGQQPWRQWGAYVSERQWGCVREDYSPGGTAWDYFPHDHARSRAYRWGEDGLAGFCDDHGQLILSLALWNEQDPILKERLFGLTNSEGNHGEDVKECYWYLDAVPTHSYLKMLYKYPQRAYPYDQLVAENRRRTKRDHEFELIDTGVFDDNRYFDIFLEYAKVDPHDVLMQITVINRGPDQARLHVIPQLWFRNIWSWRPEFNKPSLECVEPGTIAAQHDTLGRYHWYIDGEPELLFCDNDTNVHRLFGMMDAPGYFKDAFHEYVVHGNHAAVNPALTGTKAGAHFVLTIPAGGSQTIRTRLVERPLSPAFADFDAALVRRRADADEFYARLQHNLENADARAVQRQALAGLIWTQQFYHYDVARWLHGDELQPPPPTERRHGRNSNWMNLKCREVMSVPDKWEFNWFAAWDLAFHCVGLALVDSEFAKEQLVLLGREWFMHPNGQLPAYEWAFGDVNPPVHAWAAWRVYQIDRRRHGHKGDLKFLERVFHKLLINFTWWVNRKDAQNRNVFDGGFLGLDNIAVFDRSAPLPTGVRIAEADSTGWMAMYCLNLMRIALELALHDSAYESIASKFFEHFLSIVEAMNHVGCRAAEEGGISMWDDEDEWYCSIAQIGSGAPIRMKSFSMIGLIPLFAVETLEPEEMARLPEFMSRLLWLRDHRKDLASLVAEWKLPGVGERRLLAMMRGHRMKRVLARMLHETEFLSDYGVRSLSKWHQDHPIVVQFASQEYRLDYEPGESEGGLFGGNSNWRGPIWFPVNYLIIESLQKFHHYYGDDFKIECPTGSGKYLTLLEVADELSRRLTKIFLRDEHGRRPVFGQYEKIQTDPHFNANPWFHEYFHGDNGRGLGANHQTGWTALVAKLLQPKHTPRQGPAENRGENGNNQLAAQTQTGNPQQQIMKAGT
ncbi:MAG TPA: glucosidase [Pirellulales bacterium]|nr:glucosidase [Pirellulales bacterium]